VKIRLAISLLLFVFASNLFAQKVFQPKQINSNFKGLVYKDEFSFDLRLMPHGVNLGYTIGELQTYYKTTFYSFDIGFLKDSKERKFNMNTNFATEGSSDSFVYSKQNSLFILRAGKGFKRYLSEKALRRGLAVGYSFEGGVSLGVLKPYYLKLIYDVEETDSGDIREIREERYSEENSEQFLNFNSIFGGSNFWKGLFESSVAVGLHGKASGLFALGAYDKNVRAAEIGITFDAFAKKMPIFVETDNLKNRRIFLNIFISFHLGKRSQR